jgi:murein DD-endopeptidase MepM/ murein hydrolase activator NlpD
MTAIDSCRAAAIAPCCRALAIGVLVLATSACEIVPSDKAAKQDTTVAPASPAPAAGSRLPGDTSMGVPAVPSDSGITQAAPSDTGVFQLYPLQPRRGGVIFALAEGVTAEMPRCTWKGDPLPCYRIEQGVLATVPLPADDSAGTFVLTVDRPSGRLVRRIEVADRELGRDLIFLDSTRYALVRQTREIARDARAIRSIVSGESPDRLWTGRWRNPLPGDLSSGYGAERFYYPASDSTRSISLDPRARSRGSFAFDTTETPFRSSDVPSWRHSGIDIPARRGAAVSAPAAGNVVDVGEYVLSGRTLVIDHGQGVYSAYFHLDTTLVRKGDQVRAGRTIARVGSTGLSTGPHLHYAIYVHGRDVDPAAWRDMPAFARGEGRATAAAPPVP